MSPIKNVAIAGKGNVGSAALHELTKSGFNVTVLSRSADEQGPNGRTVQVDYTSLESLTSALKHHDAVVSTIGAAGTSYQKNLIDAAIAAGVRHFIPNDFGSVTTDPKARDIAVFKPFIEIQDYLKEMAATGQIQYSILATGPFLDSVFGTPLMVDLHSRSAEFLGDGSVRLSSTSISGIAKAIAGILQNPEASKNRVLHLQEAVITQAKVLDWAKKAFPGDGDWRVTSINQEQALEDATTRFYKNPRDLLTLYGLIKAVMLSGKYETEYRELDNHIVGLEQLSDEDLEERFVPLLAKKH